MIRTLRKIVKRVAHGVGYDIHRLNAGINPTYQTVLALRHFQIGLVLDVGANTGQFASEIREMGFDGSMVSFEPQLGEYRDLCKRASKDPQWLVHPRTALGDRHGELELNIAGNSVSSSLLPMTPTHTEAEPESSYMGTEIVPISTLDSVASKYLDENTRPFLKIDVQGYESQVLNGARETLPRLHGLLCELSLVPLYEEQSLWLDMIGRIEDEGFTLWALQRGFTDQRTGRTLQVDALFFRER